MDFIVKGYFLFGFLGLILGIFISQLITIFLVLLGFSSLFHIIFFLILGYVIFVVIVNEIYAEMLYNRWFYEFADSGLRLERGIIWKKYSVIPYERVQYIDIKRGILARIFGFSTVEIQTAGQSVPIYYSFRFERSEGYLPALKITEAERMKEFIMKKIKHNEEGL